MFCWSLWLFILDAYIKTITYTCIEPRMLLVWICWSVLCVRCSCSCGSAFPSVFPSVFPVIPLVLCFAGALLVCCVRSSVAGFLLVIAASSYIEGIGINGMLKIVVYESVFPVVTAVGCPSLCRSFTGLDFYRATPIKSLFTGCLLWTGEKLFFSNSNMVVS